MSELRIYLVYLHVQALDVLRPPGFARLATVLHAAYDDALGVTGVVITHDMRSAYSANAVQSAIADTPPAWDRVLGLS